MFSVGVVAYVLLCGYEPFYGTDDQTLIQANKNVDYQFHDPEWKNVSEDAKDFIRRTFHPVGECRLKPDEALRHPWLQGVADR